ncbi:MAG TPA: sensor histidine kinase [Chitinophagaceae bacterium]|jgi:two-component system, NarL family, sensor histidine kinase DesK|nr:sensor histidine kinase [Chitinophagaceae bacterium]
MRKKHIYILFSTKFLLIILLFLPGHSYCQSPVPDSFYVDLDKIATYQAIRSKTEGAYLPSDASLEGSYASLAFRGGSSLRDIPAKYINHKLILRFYAVNHSDAVDSVWFFPSFFYSSIQLYRVERNKLTSIPNVEPPFDDSMGYRLLTLGPHDSSAFLAELGFVKTYTNSIRPRLIHKTHLSTFIFDISSSHLYVNIVTYIFCGLLLMMILFSIANYLLGGSSEFLYYTGYALFLGGMLFTKIYYDLRINYEVFFMEAYLDFIMQCIGIAFYMVFMQKFLSTRSKYPFLNRLYNAGIVGLLISVLLFSYLYFFTDNFVLLNGVENTTKIVLLGMMIIFLVYCAREWKDKLLRYLFWGNLFYFFFAVFSQLIILLGSAFSSLPLVLGSALFYYELGLFLELFFFLAGLSYKNRRQIIEQTREREQLKMENERKEFEKQMAVVTAQQEERNRISTDMHDELGSGMTHIRLMSELAKSKMKQNTPVEIEKISQSADDVLNKMNAIIWSMNSKNDSLGNLISYIRAYSTEYLEGTSVKCNVSIPHDIPEKELTGDKRRNIFLCVKETLNNMLKHSGATELSVDILANEILTIRIHDNGRGIDLQKIRQFGNGLQNIKRRMESIGGDFEIKNRNGTETILTLPL